MGKLARGFLILLLVNLPLLSFAKNLSLITSGGCESEDVQGFWKESTGVGKLLSSRGWESRYLINGTPDQFRKAFPALKNEIRQSSKKVFLQELQRAARELKSGDQLLLYLNSHGSPGEICIGGPDGETISYSDPDFVKTLKNLKAKGARLGVLNEGCYGGSAIDPLKDLGCVLSGAPASYTNWGSVDLLISGSNKRTDLNDDHRYSLNDLYFDNLIQGYSKNHPNISGQDFLLRLDNEWFENFSYAKNVIACTATPQGCGQIESLGKCVKPFCDVAATAMLKSAVPGAKPFQDLLKQYKDLYSRYQNSTPEALAKERDSAMDWVNKTLNSDETNKLRQKFQFTFDTVSFFGKDLLIPNKARPPGINWPSDILVSTEHWWGRVDKKSIFLIASYPPLDPFMSGSTTGALSRNRSSKK